MRRLPTLAANANIVVQFILCICIAFVGVCTAHAENTRECAKPVSDQESSSPLIYAPELSIDEDLNKNTTTPDNVSTFQGTRKPILFDVDRNQETRALAYTVVYEECEETCTCSTASDPPTAAFVAVRPTDVPIPFCEEEVNDGVSVY